jgi:hypothetical protein
MERAPFFKLSLLALWACVLSSCTDTPLSSTDSASTNDISKGPSVLVSNANPAIVFVGSASTGKKASPYPAIMVVDADGSDVAAIYISQNSSTIFRKPTWAPTGIVTASTPWSISFTEQLSGATYLKRLSVWVENGTVKSSTPTTLASYSSTSDRAIRLQAWSPSTTTSEIVYTEVATDGSGAGKLLAIPASGGTPVELLSRATGQLAWNADGSKLAFNEPSSSGGAQITIIDRNSPSTQRSILVNQHTVIGYIDWSRSGSNQIAYGAATSATNPAWYLYTTNVSDAIPSPSQVLSDSQPVAGTDPAWSNDNSKLVYRNGSGAGLKTVTLSTGVIATLMSSGGMPDWRR